MAIGAGGFGLAASGAGLSAENHVRVDVASTIDGDGVNGVSAQSISLIAHDSSTINAVAAAVSVAASFGTGAVSVAIGVTLAHNSIANSVQASVSNAAIKLESRTGGISLDAKETSTITSVAVAAAAAIAGGIGLAASGAGVNSSNAISNDTSAFILSSGNVRSALGVTVSADDTTKISAVIVAVSLAGGMTAVAVGVSLAENVIADDVSAARSAAPP